MVFTNTFSYICLSAAPHYDDPNQNFVDQELDFGSTLFYDLVITLRVYMGHVFNGK